MNCYIASIKTLLSYVEIGTNSTGGGGGGGNGVLVNAYCSVPEIRPPTASILSYVSKMTPEPSGRKPEQLLATSSNLMKVSFTQMHWLLKECAGAGQSAEQKKMKQYKVFDSCST